MDALDAAFAHRLKQHGLQIAAMDGELRPVIAGGAARRFPINQLSEAIEENAFTRRDRHRRKRFLQSQPGQFLRGVRKHVDANPDRTYFRQLFIDTATNAGVVQGKRQRQSADAGPNDNDAVQLGQPRCSRHNPSLSCTGRSEKLNSTASPAARCVWLCQLGTTNTSRGFHRNVTSPTTVSPSPSTTE